MHYHAHVYWHTPEQRLTALNLRESLEQMGCALGTVHDKAIGPHPAPMYQVNYHSVNQTQVEQYLSNNHEGVSILLHEDTGDHVTDHTQGVRWLGEPLVLDIAWLEAYQTAGH